MAPEQAAAAGRGLPPAPRRRAVWQALRALLSIAAIAYLAYRYDLANALRTLSDVRPAYVLAGTLVLAGQVIIAALRWNFVLRGLGVLAPLPRLVRLSWVAAFLNTCLPAGVAGDAARAWLLRGETTLATAVTSVFLDRVVATLALLLLAAAAAPFVGGSLPADPGFAPVVAVMALGGLAGTVALIFADCLTPLARAIPWRIVASLAATLDRLAADARKVFRPGAALALLFACAFAGHFAICLAVYLFASGLGLALGILQWLLVVPLVLLMSALPVSLGGWGPREFAMIYLLGFFGVGGSTALSLSIAFGLCAILASLPGAWMWMTLRRATRTHPA